MYFKIVHLREDEHEGEAGEEHWPHISAPKENRVIDSHDYGMDGDIALQNHNPALDEMHPRICKGYLRQ